MKRQEGRAERSYSNNKTPREERSSSFSLCDLVIQDSNSDSDSDSSAVRIVRNQTVDGRGARFARPMDVLTKSLVREFS